jgi:hypothetical protein
VQKVQNDVKHVATNLLIGEELLLYQAAYAKQKKIKDFKNMTAV